MAQFNRENRYYILQTNRPVAIPPFHTGGPAVHPCMAGLLFDQIVQGAPFISPLVRAQLSAPAHLRPSEGADPQIQVRGRERSENFTLTTYRSGLPATPNRSTLGPCYRYYWQHWFQQTRRSMCTALRNPRPVYRCHQLPSRRATLWIISPSPCDGPPGARCWTTPIILRNSPSGVSGDRVFAAFGESPLFRGLVLVTGEIPTLVAVTTPDRRQRWSPVLPCRASARKRCHTDGLSR